MSRIRYTCEDFRPIYRDAPDAPFSDERPENIFARRIARREFGKAGIVRTLRTDSWSTDGRYANYEAFIGTRVKGDKQAVSGRNFRFAVYREVQ